MPPDVQAMLGQASALFRGGRMAEARVAYERLLARWPALPDSWYNLAMARRATGDAAAALEAYGQALARGASGAEEIHLQRAVILADDLAEPEGARAELDAALAIDPRYLPAVLNLGNLCEDGGDLEGARDAYARAVAIEPRHVLALCRSVGVADLADADDPRLARLDAIARDPARDPRDRADAGFALGAQWDRLGAYDRAWPAFERANAAAERVAHVSGIAFSPSELSAAVDRSITAFAEPAPAGGDGRDLVFVCGMFRSGSTLVERILAAHGAVDAGGEIAALPALAGALRPYPEAAAQADPDVLAAMRAQYRAQADGRRRGGRLLIDKRPDNILHLGLAKRLFPAAKIVWTTRDARDTALSVFFLHAAVELAYATRMEHIAHVQREQARLMAHWRTLYPGDIHEVRYERLVASPIEEVAALVAFLGLAPEPTLHERFFAGGAVRTASNWQVRRPLYVSSVGRWRNYPHVFGLPADG